MMNSIFTAGTFSNDAVLLSMAAALVLGFLIALFYKASNAEGGTLVVVLTVLPLLVQSIIMVVNGNIGTSVAVLGAFGLIRFRSAPGSAKEIGFIFLAMAVGLATGMGFILAGTVLTVVVGVLILLMEKTNFTQVNAKERQLRITIPEDLNYNGIFDDLFLTYTSRFYLEQVKTTSMGTMFELCYRIQLRDAAKEKEFMDALRCRNGNLSIILGLVRRSKNEL